jgi:hypothetical protein
MLLSFVILTACSGVFNTSGNKQAGIAVVAFIFIYFFHYDIGEFQLPLEIRTKLNDIGYTPLLFGYTTEVS